MLHAGSLPFQLLINLEDLGSENFLMARVHKEALDGRQTAQAQLGSCRNVLAV